jgi:hypothetical protein
MLRTGSVVRKEQSFGTSKICVGFQRQLRWDIIYSDPVYGYSCSSALRSLKFSNTMKKQGTIKIWK